MDANVQLKLGAYPMSVNEKGEPELGDAQSRTLKLTNKQLEDFVFAANNFDEFYENLRGSGVYITMENSKTFIVPVNEGTVIFFNDGQLQEKITLDKEISPDVALQIETVKNRDELEEILIQNRIIERPETEMDKETTLDDKTVDIDVAEKVNEKDMTQDNPIAQNMYERYKEPDRSERRASREMDGMDR